MRKNRQLKPDATYHVTAHINTGRVALEPDEFKKLFMQVVKDAKEKHSFSLKNFVIMDNHIHFLIKPLLNSSLSKIMQWILAVFAIRYNKETESSGHVWRSRFWSEIKEDEEAIEAVFKYIAENPVKAEIVKEARDYVYSGVYYILQEIFEIVDKPDDKLMKICNEYG